VRYRDASRPLPCLLQDAGAPLLGAQRFGLHAIGEPSQPLERHRLVVLLAQPVEQPLMRHDPDALRPERLSFPDA
jgi:hypothetical protein